MPTCDFGITQITSQLGEDLTLTHISSHTVNDYGDATNTTSSLTVNGVAEIQDSEQVLVKEGLLKAGDLIFFVDEDATNATSIALGDTLAYDSLNYRVLNIIHNKGHYEVWAARI